MFFSRKRDNAEKMNQAKGLPTYITPSASVYTPFLTMVGNNHLLVAGASGSGKSVAINGIITSLIMKYSPYDVQFIFADPKRVELSDYKNIPHCVFYANNKETIIKCLTMACIEMERRYKIMETRREKNFSGSKLYIVIDELSDIMTSYKKDCFPLLLKLAQLGRAAKCFLVCATQNVLSKILTTEFKCNFTVILGLRTQNKQQSRTILDDAGLESLPNPQLTHKGEGIIRDGADYYPVMIYKYPDEEINRIINHWTTKKCIA